MLKTALKIEKTTTFFQVDPKNRQILWKKEKVTPH